MAGATTAPPPTWPATGTSGATGPGVAGLMGQLVTAQTEALTPRGTTTLVGTASAAMRTARAST
eukprot:9018-Pyramimonas_sp.AAC.1